MISPKTLSLVPNPWAAIDAEGRPAGICRRDPDEGVDGFVGARVVATLARPAVTRKIGPYTQTIAPAKHATAFEFDLNPVTVPNTPYYQARAGRAPYELFPADEKTARTLGVDFIEPGAAIEVERLERVAEFDAQHGQGSWQYLEDERELARLAAQETEQK